MIEAQLRDNYSRKNRAAVSAGLVELSEVHVDGADFEKKNRPGEDQNRPGEEHNRSGEEQNRPEEEQNRPGEEQNRQGEEHNRQGEEHNRQGEEQSQPDNPRVGPIRLFWTRAMRWIRRRISRRDSTGDDSKSRAVSNNSLYRLVRQLVARPSDADKQPGGKWRFAARDGERDEQKPSTGRNERRERMNWMEQRQLDTKTLPPVPSTLDVSSPLTREMWKDDAQLVLTGTFARLSSTKFADKYRAVAVIGQGSFGFVLRAQRVRDGRDVAVKFILRQNINAAAWIFNAELGMVPSEVHFLHSLQHPGIVQFLDHFDDGKYVYLVTELFGTSWSPSNPLLNGTRNPGLKRSRAVRPETQEEAPCDLFECIEAHHYLPERTIHKMFCQLYDVVRYLASRGIVHRDIKDENVVVGPDYQVKIVDFGSATLVPRLARGVNAEGLQHEGWFDKFNGTLAFAPPEVIRGMLYRGSEAEVWTLGILLFTMAFRQTPFPDAQAILYGCLDFPYGEDRPGILDLLRKLLAKNPTQRIKLDEIGRHPWMGATGKDAVGEVSALNASAESVLMRQIE